MPKTETSRTENYNNKIHIITKNDVLSTKKIIVLDNKISFY
jgi:hypothetical protein